MIERRTVEEIALLARLKLSDEEITALTRELGAIAGYVAKLTEVDVSGVTDHVPDDHHVNIWREDEERPGLSVTDALANAPEQETGYIKVPPVVE